MASFTSANAVEVPRRMSLLNLLKSVAPVLRCLFVTCRTVVIAAAWLFGCSRHSAVKQPVVQASPHERVIEIFVSNRTNAPAPLTVRADGRPVFSGLVAPRERRHVGFLVGDGEWHRIVSQSGTRPPHQAIVRSDKRKWVTVKVDAARRDGVGVHISENGSQ